MPESPRGPDGKYLPRGAAAPATTPPAAPGIVNASAADSAADLRRERDEARERLKAAEGRTCGSCGGTILGGKMRPAAGQTRAAAPAAASGAPAASAPAPAPPASERTFLDDLGGG